MTRDEYLRQYSSISDEYGSDSEEAAALQWRENLILRVCFFMFSEAADKSMTGERSFYEEDFVARFGEDVKDVLEDVKDQIDEVLGDYLIDWEYREEDGCLSLNFGLAYIPEAV